MNILCDANMPFAAQAFARLGRVRVMDGRQIGPEDVREVDILATRSTTRVTRSLLANSRVRFYGTATIGYDHVDTGYLAERGIPWTAAPGCNAESVAQYVTAALTTLAQECDRSLDAMTLGVVGVGNVGRRVVRKARALGMRVLAHDPPRQRDPSDEAARAFVSLDRLLPSSDVVTLHTPLNLSGQDVTLGLFDRRRLSQMRRGAWLFNAARGEVTQSDDLLAAIAEGQLSRVVLDTWEGEPAVRRDVLRQAAIATPHIAGHSYEGKVNGTLMVYEAACRFLGVEPDFHPELPVPPMPSWQPPADTDADTPTLVAAAVRATYDIRADERRMRETLDTGDDAARSAAFDRLRKAYPMRREFAATRICARTLPADLGAILRQLGFASASENKV